MKAKATHTVVFVHFCAQFNIFEAKECEFGPFQNQQSLSKMLILMRVKHIGVLWWKIQMKNEACRNYSGEALQPLDF